MLKDVALNTGVFAGAVVGVAVGSAGGFTGAEGVVGAGFAGAFLLLTVTLHLYVFLPTLALIYAVPFFFAVTTPFLLTVFLALGQGKLCFVQFDLRGTYRCGIHCQTHYYK